MNKMNDRLTWSFAGPWYWEYTKDRKQDDSPLFPRIDFAIEYQFDVLPVNFSDLDGLSIEKQDEIFELLNKNNITFRPHVGMNWVTATAADAEKYSENWKESFNRFRRFYGCNLVTTCLHPTHRFSRERTITEKIKHFSEILTPIALTCAECGCIFGVENHGDYYVSELAELCKITPNTGIFFDTGNCFLVGEKPVKAAEDAAPFVVGTHFKDHFVTVNEKDLRLELDGAPLGDGDVGLKEIYEVLMDKCDNPEKIIMEIELVASRGADPIETLERSMEFVNSLS